MRTQPSRASRSTMKLEEVPDAHPRLSHIAFVPRGIRLSLHFYDA